MEPINAKADPRFSVLLFAPNADNGERELQYVFDEYVSGYQKSSIFFGLSSLGLQHFFGEGIDEENILNTLEPSARNLYAAVLKAALAMSILKIGNHKYRFTEQFLAMEPCISKLEKMAEYHSLYAPYWMTISNHRNASCINLSDMSPYNWINCVGNSHERLFEWIVENISFGVLRRILDIGAGTGELTRRFLQKSNGAFAELIELDPIAPVTKLNLQSSDVAQRAKVLVGDAVKVDLGVRMYDLVIMSNVVHLIHKENRDKLLSKCSNALSEGGSILIIEPMLNDDQSTPRTNTLFNVSVLLRSSGKGGLLTLREIEDLMVKCNCYIANRYEIGPELDLFGRHYSVLVFKSAK